MQSHFKFYFSPVHVLKIHIMLSYCSNANNDDDDHGEDGPSAKRMKTVTEDEDDDYFIEVNTYSVHHGQPLRHTKLLDPFYTTQTNGQSL